MKLGIVVVYLVSAEDARLLDIHLGQIVEHTEVPFVIYGSANRLLPQFRSRLEGHPHVKICRCQTTPLRGYEEHAYYLEELIRIAIEDGVTHLALLNVDSFPIRRGWAREMAEFLSPRCVMSAVMRTENDDCKPHPSGMLFSRDFYVRHQPTILLSKEELSSPEFLRYRAGHEVIVDTGVGYGFKIYTQNLDWHPLTRSNTTEDHYIIGSIYGDLIFHLGGAARDAKFHIRERRRIDAHRDHSMLSRSRARILKLGSRVVPLSIREKLRPFVVPRSTRRIQAQSQEAYERARAHLLRDPDGYFDYLRSGSTLERPR